MLTFQDTTRTHQATTAKIAAVHAPGMLSLMEVKPMRIILGAVLRKSSVRVSFFFKFIISKLLRTFSDVNPLVLVRHVLSLVIKYEPSKPIRL